MRKFGGNVRKFLKNVSYLMLVNALSFLISAIVTFIVPKFLSVSQYSYFQLYLFYMNYIGFCCIGWVDGIVLRYAGKYFEDLNLKLFKGQLVMYSALEIIIGVFIIILVMVFQPTDVNKATVFTMVGIAIILSLINAFFRYLMQAVNYIDKYAKNILIEKAIYFLGVILALLFGKFGFIYMISADLLGKAASLMHMLIVNRAIVSARMVSINEILIEAKENIRVGIKLLIANGASLLIVGIVRYSIQSQWDVETFGKVSLSLSVSNMFMGFIQAVGVSLFPMLRRINQDKLSKLYLTIRHMLMFPMLGCLIFYYPVYVILSAWLPEYAESLHYMAIMFPICIFESKIQLLTEPYLKSLRKEASLLKVNVFMVVLSLIFSAVSVGLLKNLNLTVLNLVILLGIRCLIMELVVEKAIGVRLKKDIIQELVLVALFICFNWCIGGFLGLALYLMFYVAYIGLNYKAVLETGTFVIQKLKH